MSKVKTLVVIEVLRHVEKGKLSLDQQFTILPEDMASKKPMNMTFLHSPTTTT